MASKPETPFREALGSSRGSVPRPGRGPDLLYIDLHLRPRGDLAPGLRRPARAAGPGPCVVPDLSRVATMDHNVPTSDLDKPFGGSDFPRSRWTCFARNCEEFRHPALRDARPRPGHRGTSSVRNKGLTQARYMTIVVRRQATPLRTARSVRLAFGIGTSGSRNTSSPRKRCRRTRPGNDGDRRRRLKRRPAFFGQGTSFVGRSSPRSVPAAAHRFRSIEYYRGFGDPRALVDGRPPSPFATCRSKAGGCGRPGLRVAPRRQDVSAYLRRPYVRAEGRPIWERCTRRVAERLVTDDRAGGVRQRRCSSTPPPLAPAHVVVGNEPRRRPSRSTRSVPRPRRVQPTTPLAKSGQRRCADLHGPEAGKRLMRDIAVDTRVHLGRAPTRRIEDLRVAADVAPGAAR